MTATLPTRRVHEESESPAPATPALPYGPRFTRRLPAVHRAFLALNRYAAVPLLRSGMAPLMATPIAGSLMILRTCGRTSGLWRDAPLGYVIFDGAVYCCAGFGRSTQWLRNIQVDSRVEILLAAGAFSGTAEEVDDPGEWSRAMRALLLAMGIVGRATVGDIRHTSDEGLVAMAGGIPLVRVRVTGLASGPFDPGGFGWVLPTVLSATWLARWMLRRHGNQAKNPNGRERRQGDL